MTITNAAELRDTYLHVYAAFATDPMIVVDEVPGITNVRFARELLGTLVTAGLVGQTEGENGDVWQTYPDTYDNMTLAEAEARIDNWLNDIDKDKTMTTTTTTKPRSATKTKDEGFHKCYCGCGNNVPTKSYYSPGHDARHAGEIGRKIAANYATPGFDRRELLNELPSDRLQAKAEAIAEKAVEKAVAKEARAAERAAAKANKTAEPVQGVVTVGKKTREAVKNADGTVEYLDDKDEWKIASKTASTSFQPAE